LTVDSSADRDIGDSSEQSEYWKRIERLFRDLTRESQGLLKCRPGEGACEEIVSISVEL